MLYMVPAARHLHPGAYLVCVESCDFAMRYFYVWVHTQRSTYQEPDVCRISTASNQHMRIW